jgi:ABC-2 type transport system permease protein
MKQFAAIFVARSMEFVRDRGTFFWNLLFPVVLVAGFGFAFSGPGDALFTVGTIGSADDLARGGADAALAIPLLDLQQAEVVTYDPVDREAVLERVRRHQLDMLVDFERGVFVLNSESNAAPVLRLLMSGGSENALREESVSGAPIRYVDWLIPGVIGMNMMFSCLFGVGFVIVRYRKNGVLKRLKATPVSALTFVTAQAFSRFVIVIITSVVVFLGTNLIFSFVMNGSYLTLLVLTMAAILCMIAIGLVFAARLRSEELANGLMNLVTLPMLVLSGVFFSLEGSPEILQGISRFLPLTHFTEGARAVMVDGAGIVGVLPNIVVLLAIATGATLLSAALFRWE